MSSPTRSAVSLRGGFNASISSAVARRQLHMSAGVVAVLAAATIASLVALHMDRSTQARHPERVAISLAAAHTPGQDGADRHQAQGS